jgi:uncharacterized membrane protein
MKPSQETQDQWSKDPKNWKWGVFYYNKEDKRIFPPKRIPWMGWTINFANPKSILAFLIVLLFFLFVVNMINKNH